MVSAAPPSPFAGFSLTDKFTREEGRIYLTGIQALVRLPMDQHRADARHGLRTSTFISGYRGSPLGGFDMELDRARHLLDQHHVVHQPGLNEELAATAVFGAQSAHYFPQPRYDGVLGMWYGKGPGVDRTGDAFKHANHAGVGPNGGVLVLGGDDPSSKSSTLPSASEIAFYDAMMPTLYPGSVQDVLDLGLHGFALSRASGLWAAMKMVTNVCDGSGTAEVSPERVRPSIPTVELDGRPFTPSGDWKLLAPYNLEMERTLHTARIELARRYARDNRLNQMTVNPANAWLGILAAGKTYFDVRQALDELGLTSAELERRGIRLLKMAMLFPFDKETVREFARGLDEVLVIEEKRPFLETFTRDALYSAPDRPLVVGKLDEQERPLVPAAGELDADQIARVIAARVGRKLALPAVNLRLRALDAAASRPAPLTLSAPRTAYYCSGCPHNRGTLIPEGSIVAAGIGCHSMAIWMDPTIFGEIVGITQMGAEGAQWVGASHFTETGHIFQNIGDGTLFHSGGLALNFAVASGVNITYKILYNSAVAMTGGQLATGQLPVPALARRLEAEGVKKILITTDEPERYHGVALPAIAEVRHRDDTVEAQRALASIPGVTVHIHDQQCAAEKRRLRKRGRMVDPTTRVWINERVCEGCGDCGRRSNCLSVQPVETEFGRKTQIHQSSCNKDYSCLLGDCPAFVTVNRSRQSEDGSRPAERRTEFGMGEDAPGRLPAPTPRIPTETFTLHLMGIGGTGVVTVNQILATAALLDGRHVWGLDQTGLSQKGGPVMSDLRISTQPLETGKLTAGGADVYIGFDVLVAVRPDQLKTCDPERTVAVISTSQIPTGGMITNTRARFPAFDNSRAAIDAVTRAADNIYVDAQGISEELFGDHMPANLLLVGAAYQAGLLPLSAAAIEQAVRLNGAAVEENLAAFQYGRTLGETSKAVGGTRLGKEEAAGGVSVNGNGPHPSDQAPSDAFHVELFRAPRAAHRTGTDPSPLPAPDARTLQLLAETGVHDEAELRRLLLVRIPELIAYQHVEYARRYTNFLRNVLKVERARTPGQTALSEAVARYLYKLMAYKDEYEVARLHLDAAEQAKLAGQFGTDAEVRWHLHPPMLRALGLDHKLELGAWFAPAMRSLAEMRRLRGTPLDPFGKAQLRRIERALIDEYEAMLKRALPLLTPASHAKLVELAALPDMVRGYEQVKLDNVKAYRERAAALLAELSPAAAGT